MDDNTKISDLTVGEFRLLMSGILVDHEAHMIYRKYNGSGVIGAPVDPYAKVEKRGTGNSPYGQQASGINLMEALHGINQSG
jgi:hypothetical protein